MKFGYKATCVLSVLAAILALGRQSSFGQGQPTQAPPTPTIAEDIPGVIKGGTTVEAFVRDRSQSTEGPNRLPDGDVIFSERPLNRITRMNWRDNSFAVWQPFSYGAQGMSFDPQGRLVATQVLPEDAAMTVGIIYPEDKVAILADVFDGIHLTRPNDLTIASNGGIYFTDPGRNKLPRHRFGPTPPLPRAIYYIPPGPTPDARRRSLRRVSAGEVNNLNGLILSPDEKLLYAHNPGGPAIVAFDVQPDGALRNRRDFARYELVNGKPPGGDGLIVDAAGRLYACTTPGLQVYSPQGQYMGKIPMFRNCQNPTFIGPERNILFAVGQGILYKAPMLTQGPARGR